MDAAGLAQVRTIVTAYVRGNLTNLIALTALRLRLDQPDAPAAHFTPAAAPPPAAPLPALPRIDALDAALAGRVRSLAARHEGAGEKVIPSLYLALAPWPDVLAALPGWLAPLYAPDALRAARDSAVQAAARRRQPTCCRPQVPRRPASPPCARGWIASPSLVIPDLVPVCLALDALLPRG